jgi:OOP family OmpA-OmpF porin
MRKLLVWVAAALAWSAATPAGAQPMGVQVTLSPFAGGARWDAAVPRDDGLHFGGRAGLALSRWLGIEGTYGLSPHENGADDTRINHVGADAVVSIPLHPRLTPYVLGGWASLELDPDLAPVQTLNGWEFGGGLRLGLRQPLSLRLDVRDVTVESDPSGDRLHNILYTGGLHLAFGGRRRDADGDGVPDRSDRCPDTPAGAVVDARGCPVDADSDAVADGLDTCPDTPRGARVDARGCPIDSDGDGVFDGLDRCADTPRGAAVDAAGCPQDADGDGVPDGVDQCFGTPTGARVNALGCPLDSDGDEVYDGLDRCPDTPAEVRVDSEGCPIAVSDKETQLLETGLLRLEDVHFDTGKATLRPESNAVLDEVGAILVEWPQLRIEIGGYTDSRGSAAFNRELSQRRAQAVLEYLQTKFPTLGAGQFITAGYGESLPVADNRTEAGRARNRRVEFKVLDRETLRKEVERRRLLRKN